MEGGAVRVCARERLACGLGGRRPTPPRGTVAAPAPRLLTRHRLGRRGAAWAAPTECPKSALTALASGLRARSLLWACDSTTVSLRSAGSPDQLQAPQPQDRFGGPLDRPAPARKGPLSPRRGALPRSQPRCRRLASSSRTRAEPSVGGTLPSQPGSPGRQDSSVPLLGKLCSECRPARTPRALRRGVQRRLPWPSSPAGSLRDPPPPLDSSGRRGRPGRGTAAP